MRRILLLSGLGMALLAQAREGGLEERVQALERTLSSRTLVEMLQQVDQLQNEVQSLRGQVETLENSLTRMREAQQRRYLDLDARLRRLEGEGTPPPATAEPAAELPLSPPLQRQPSGAPTEAEQEAYRRAFGQLQAGHYDAAIDAFSQFLQHHPASSLTPNAFYWLGEAYYVKRDFKAAGDAFQQVLDHFPASPKTADALLKLGYVAYEQGRWGEARRYLEEVVHRFSGTRAAQLAAERLERLKRENRY